MDKKIKLTSLLLALTLTLAACGTSDSNSDNTSEDNSSNQQTEETSNDSSTEDDDNNDDANDSTENDDGDDNASPETDSSEINLDSYDSTIEDAIKKAQSNFDGQLTDIGLERENNKWVYKIELESDSEEYDVSYDVNTLDIIEEEKDSENDDEYNEYFKYEDLITFDEAITTAKSEVDGKATEISTDFDDGVLYYEVSIQNQNGEDVDVIIDAKSGETVEIDE
ncbi:MAG TPA: PepSY domain-containing protein [Jeotgalicoccus sp.]|nr:PepSY domain-containing protein [Jeotgalicoccus sp.]